MTKTQNATTREAGKYAKYAARHLQFARNAENREDYSARDAWLEKAREYVELALGCAAESGSVRAGQYAADARKVLEAIEWLETHVRASEVARNGTSLPPVAPVDLAPPAEAEKTTDRPRRVTTELVLSWDGETEPLTLGELRELVGSLKDHPDDHVLYAESSGTAYVIRTTR